MDRNVRLTDIPRMPPRLKPTIAFFMGLLKPRGAMDEAANAQARGKLRPMRLVWLGFRGIRTHFFRRHGA